MKVSGEAFVASRPCLMYSPLFHRGKTWVFEDAVMLLSMPYSALSAEFPSVLLGVRRVVRTRTTKVSDAVFLGYVWH